MALIYTKAERISLKSHPELTERWLQDRIADDPTILGLGDVNVLDRERVQGTAGRLDLLLSNPDENRRYEVELMLGPTDPSHIIRTLEYWDIERRRYPAYDHVAVLVAEDITSRFLNVMSLFSGTIPLIAMQLSALKVGDHVVLDFVKVLDQTELRTDDEEEGDKTPADRSYWEQKSSGEVLGVVDRVAAMINERATQRQNLNYNRHFIGLNDGVRSRNFVLFYPRKKHVGLRVQLNEPDKALATVEDAGLDATIKKGRYLRFKLTPALLETHHDVVAEVFHQAAADHESD